MQFTGEWWWRHEFDAATLGMTIFIWTAELAAKGLGFTAMKMNGRVTTVEQAFSADQRLISATDVTGKITYCNSEFIRISGYSEQELLGNPHNLVRHPEMPAAVFGVMWQYLRAGKSWMGVVKNRCKNGDFYWVSAYVTPILDHGKVVGYESVRVKPTREQVERAQKLYDRIKAGQNPVPQSTKIAYYAKTLRAPVVAASLAVIAIQMGTDFVAEAVAATVIIGAGLWSKISLESTLKGVIGRNPNAFSDPISALAYSDTFGPEAQLEMVLISEDARLRTALTRLSDLANQVSESAAHTSLLSKQTERALVDQRSETDMTATAMTEMTASIAEVAGNVQQTANEAQTASSLAAQGDKVAQSTRGAIEALTSTVSKISDAVDTLAGETQQIMAAAGIIQSIADQTNLLALNAAIEAARAGEQGRGFAVVADEVRSLASKTRESTLQIQSVIETLKTGADEAVSVARLGISEAETGLRQVISTQNALQGIRDAVDRISAMSLQMAAASEQQSHVSEDISQQINNFASTVDRTADDARTAVDCGTELEQSAQGLQALVERFNR